MVGDGVKAVGRAHSNAEPIAMVVTAKQIFMVREALNIGLPL